MNKLKIFISSRVKSSFENLDGSFSLKDLRQYIKHELEAEKFLGEEILDVVINETDFNGTIAKDAFNNCLDTMRSCNVIIILFNGEAGWSVTGNDTTNGICHEEFLIAINEFSDMSFLVDIKQYFNLPEIGAEKNKNDDFALDILSFFRHKETIDSFTIEELKTKIIIQIKKYILTTIEKSFLSQKRLVAGSSIFGETLDWSKLNYTERQEALLDKIKLAFESVQSFSNILKAFHAIPDNMSVADARNLIGRPFLNEHTLIGDYAEGGVIHVVGIYGNATEIQVKPGRIP